MAAAETDQFLNLLSRIANNEFDKLSERYQQLSVADQLLYIDGVQKQLREDEERWIRAVKDAVIVVLEENNENKKRYFDKKYNTFKFTAFSIFWKMMDLQIQDPLQDLQFSDVFEGVYSCLNIGYLIKDVNSKSNLYMGSVEIAHGVCSVYQAIDISSVQLKKLWNILMDITENSFTTGSKKERAKVVETISYICRDIKKTHFFSIMPDVIKKIGTLIRTFKWENVDPTRTAFLKVINYLIVFGAELHRDVLLDEFFYLAEERLADVKIKSAEKSTGDSDGRTDYTDNLHAFVENVLVLCFPDCEKNSTNRREGRSFVEQAYEYLFSEVDDVYRKSRNQKNKYVLPDSKVPLLARIALLQHQIFDESTEQPGSPTSKRKRSNDVLGDLVRSGRYYAFQVLLEVLLRWKHRLKSRDCQSLAVELMHLDRKTIRQDDKVSLYLRIMAILLEQKINMSAEKYNKLWLWTVSLIQTSNTHAAACQLVCSIIPYYQEVLQASNPADVLNVLSFQLAQLPILTEPALRLLFSVLTNFEFDENLCFRADIRGLSGLWLYRSQVLYAVLKRADPKCCIDNVVAAILNYHPSEVPPFDPFPKPIIEQFEIDLTRRFCVLQLPKPPLPKCFSLKDNSIPSMVVHLKDYLKQLFDLALEESDDRRVFYWRTCLFAKKHFDGVFEDLLAEIEESIICDLATEDAANVLAHLDVGVLWSEASERLRSVVEEISNNDQCLEFKRYFLFWDADVGLNKVILEDEKVVDSPRFENFIVETCMKTDFSFHDLSYIQHRFSTRFSHTSNLAIAKKLMHEITVEVELTHEADYTASLTDRFAYNLLRYVDLHDRELYDAVRLHLLQCDFLVSKFAHKLPITLLSDQDLQMVTSNLEPMVFLRLLCVSLDLFHIQTISDALLSKMLTIDPEIFEEFLPHFEEYVNFWSPRLAYLLPSVDGHPTWSLRLNSWLDKPLLQLLHGVRVPVDDTFSPAIFYLPVEIVERLLTNHTFSCQWFVWKDKTIFYRLFCNLRNAIYDFRESMKCNSIRINYPLVMLRSVCKLFKAFEYPMYVPDDILALVLVLFSDALNICSDDVLAQVIDELFVFLNQIIVPDSQESIGFKKLLLLDLLLERAEQFPKTVAATTAIVKKPDFYAYRKYFEFVSSNFTTDEPWELLNIMSSTTEFMDYFIDFCFPQLQLRGFWELFRRRLLQKLDTNALYLLIPMWMFFPRLRPVLIELLVLYPASVVDPALKDPNYLFKRFVDDLDDRMGLEGFASQTTFVVLWNPTVVHEPTVTEALYDMIATKVDNQDLSESLLMRTDFDESNYCGRIIRQIERHINKEPWMKKFFTVAVKTPLLSALTLAHLICHFSDERSMLTLVDRLNDTFSTLLAEFVNGPRSQSERSDSPTTSSFCFTESQMTTLEPTVIGDQFSATSGDSIFDQEAAILFLFAAVQIAESKKFSRKLEELDLLPFCQCLVKARMFVNAHFFLKRLIDFSDVSQRDLFGLNSCGSLLESLNKAEWENLMADILIGRMDAESMSQLSLKVRAQFKSRLLMAEAKKDWGAVTSICNAMGDKDRQSRALLFLGCPSSGSSQEAQYEATVQLAAWEDLAESVSFPKKVDSHWGRLFAILKRHRDDKPYRNWEFIDSHIESVATKVIVDPRKLASCRHFLLLRSLSHNLNSSIPDNILRCSFHLVDISRDSLTEVGHHNVSVMNAVTDVVKQAHSMRQKGAPLASMKLLDSLKSIYESDERRQALFGPVRQRTVCLSDVVIEKAKALVACGEKDTAILSLSELIACYNRDTTHFAERRERTIFNLSRAFKLLSKLQSHQELNHLKCACNYAQMYDPAVYNRNLIRLAAFSEREYQSFQDYMETPAFQLKQDLIDNFSADQQSKLHVDKPDQFLELTKRKEVECERADMENIRNCRRNALHASLTHYLDVLRQGTPDSTIVFRVVALLVKNTKDTELINVARKAVEAIKTSVWLPVVNVLSSHLFSKDPISGLVEDIAIGVVRDFPYITVSHFLFYRSLESTDNDVKIRQDKVTAMLNKCQEKDQKVADIILAQAKAHRCFAELCTIPFEDTTCFRAGNGNEFELKNGLRIIKHLKHLKDVPIPIARHPIFESGSPENYNKENFVRIADVERKCFRADGKSSPKVIVFCGSDGKSYKAVFKSGEDLRQDGLVQQLFTVANLIMKQKPACPDIFSPLRTYQVVPLGPNCGIIEWCEGTTSLCNYLIGPDRKSGAHRRYRPKDMTSMQARDQMKAIHTRKDSVEVFERICNRIQPVFRYFFYEKFPAAASFHAAIDRYTQSLAQWSIVCYVVGLGDRHLNNILLDTTRAELVHIDLGMVFEFSKRTLPVPERIPFRLTRDIVDPLIIDGVNGHFRRIAVHTMRQMRNNSLVLSGVASVLINDPISTFAVVAQRQSTERPRHFVAEAAISRLKEKLAGKELSQSVKTVEDQVDKLIAEAQSKENLSKVFVGWMPFI